MLRFSFDEKSTESKSFEIIEFHRKKSNKKSSDEGE